MSIHTNSLTAKPDSSPLSQSSQVSRESTDVIRRLDDGAEAGLTRHVLADVSVGGKEWVRCSCGQWAREWLPVYEYRPSECGIVGWRRAWSRRVGDLYVDMVERAILNGAREQGTLDRLLAVARG